MYLIKTKLARTTVNAALMVALVLSTPVLAATDAGEATLTHNERTAQRAIVDAPVYGRIARSGEPAEATLAHNERAAQRAIADSSNSGEFPGNNAAHGAMGEASLAHSELAAQRAIKDGPTYSRSTKAGRSSAALAPVTSTEPAAAR